MAFCLLVKLIEQALALFLRLQLCLPFALTFLLLELHSVLLVVDVALRVSRILELHAIDLFLVVADLDLHGVDAAVLDEVVHQSLHIIDVRRAQTYVRTVAWDLVWLPPFEEPVHLQLVDRENRQCLDDFENVLALVDKRALLLHVVLEADLVPLGLLGDHLERAVVKLLDVVVEERVHLLEGRHWLRDELADDILGPLVDELVELLLLGRRERFGLMLHGRVQVGELARVHQLEKVVLVLRVKLLVVHHEVGKVVLLLQRLRGLLQECYHGV